MARDLMIDLFQREITFSYCAQIFIYALLILEVLLMDSDIFSVFPDSESEPQKKTAQKKQAIDKVHRNDRKHDGPRPTKHKRDKSRS
jgi:hypothetical protein